MRSDTALMRALRPSNAALPRGRTDICLDECIFEWIASRDPQRFSDWLLAEYDILLSTPLGPLASLVPGEDE
jgi:hypothetical protein